MSDEEIDKIVRVCKRILRKKNASIPRSSTLRSLAANLLALKLDLRTSYLSDSVVPKCPVDFAQELKREVLEDANICLIELPGSDVVFARRDLLTRILLAAPDHFVFVDVTGAPAVVEDPPRLAVLHAWAEKMAKDVSSREGVVEVAEGSINLTTAAGMLLGYPIVYWYQEDEAVPWLGELRVTEVWLGEDVLFSFSCPSAVVENHLVSSHLKKWETSTSDKGLTTRTTEKSDVTALAL